jgi:hypothetical protein
MNVYDQTTRSNFTTLKTLFHRRTIRKFLSTMQNTWTAMFLVYVSFQFPPMWWEFHKIYECYFHAISYLFGVRWSLNYIQTTRMLFNISLFEYVNEYSVSIEETGKLFSSWVTVRFFRRTLYCGDGYVIKFYFEECRFLGCGAVYFFCEPTFRKNVGSHKNYTALHTRKGHSS